ncbi:MAG: DUF4124 domain-containing protein [Burkholderiales bacterium]|nr:DUF4124 domain-containing protein [Burkholderiales bacterium]
MSPKFVPVLICLVGLLAVAESGAAAKQSKKVTKGAVPSAKIYKWVDERGVTHYGEIIPPQYRDKAATEMSRGGVAVRQIHGAMTPEQRMAAEERARREQEEQQREVASRRRDTALLATYTSAREIDAARERTLALPQQAIRGLQPRLQHAQARMDKLEEQAGRLRSAGRQVPPHLAEDIDLQRQAMGEIRIDRDRHDAEIAAINRRFDEDKQRFAELTEVAHR